MVEQLEVVDCVPATAEDYINMRQRFPGPIETVKAPEGLDLRGIRGVCMGWTDLPPGKVTWWWLTAEDAMKASSPQLGVVVIEGQPATISRNTVPYSGPFWAADREISDDEWHAALGATDLDHPFFPSERD